jgi:anti-sigma factor RsiW
MKGSSLTLHPEEEQLLRYLDGELPVQAAGEVRSHLEACWQCRAALEELQDVVSQCVHYRKNVLQRHLPTPPAPWVDIYRHFDEIDASLEPALFRRITRLLKSPFDTGVKKWALAAVALLVVLGLFYRYRQTPSVQAAELLRQAVAKANAHSLQPRRIQIRTRNRRLTRPAVATLQTGFAAADADALQDMFQRANYSWTDPLSAQSFQAWRSQLADKRDHVIEENQAYEIETSTSASELRQATLKLRAADLRPVEERLEFSNQEWVEITEVADDAVPPVPISASGETRRPAGNPRVPSSEASNDAITSAPAASAADELQVIAALHDVGADLGDPVEVSRSGSEVVVSGIGLAPGRQQQIKSALGTKAHVVVRFSDSPAASVPDQPVAPNDTPTAGDVRQLQARLAEQLGGRANLEQLSAQVLDSSESLMARAYALRRLSEQFPLTAERELSDADRQLLTRLRAEHSTALRQQVTDIDRALQPILATVPGDAGSAPNSGNPAEPWQAATEELFQSARRLDKLVGVMFGAAPSETPVGQLPAQLKTGLAQLHARLDIYERSNK